MSLVCCCFAGSIVVDFSMGVISSEMGLHEISA